MGHPKFGRCDGISRRDCLRVGSLSALGLSLVDRFRRPAFASDGTGGRAKSCILLWLDGGPSHLETFDLKPMAPAEVRGPFRPIATSVSGMQLCELLPETAKLAGKLAIIRSMTPGERRDPKGVLNGRRRKRIAAGSGTTVTEVNRLVKQFAEVQKVMRSAAKMAGQQGARPKGVRGAKGQAAALRQMQQQLGGGGTGAGLGGFSGLQKAPTRRSR